MNWPFKTIKQESSWPLQPMLVSLAAAVIQSGDVKPAAAKTIERVCRMAARLAVEFKAPPMFVMEVMAAQLVREGGPKFAAVLKEAAGIDADNLDAGLDAQNMLTDLMDGFGKEGGSDEPN